jgi:hypothetical protein
VRATLSNGECPSPFLSFSSTPTIPNIPERKIRKPLLAIMLAAIIVLSIVLIFQFVPSVHAVSEFEYFDPASPVNVVQDYGVGWSAQTFTVGASSHNVTQIRTLLSVTSTPGTSTLSIRATSGGVPTGSDLTSGTFTPATGWNNVSVTEITLSASTMYAFIARCPSGSSSKYFYEQGVTSGGDNGVYISSDSGSSWVHFGTNREIAYEIWGNALASDYPPTYTTIGSNETIAGNPVNCYVLWAANSSNPSYFIFSTNNTGPWVNQTAAAVSSNWGNYSFTLNATVGVPVGWKEWCNDTGGSSNSTAIQTITTTFYSSITVVTTTHSWSLNPGDVNQTVTGTWINLTVTANANFDVQVEGSGALSDGGGHTIALSNVRAGSSVVTSSVALTTSFQNVTGLTNQASGTSLNVAFKLWASAPTPQYPGTYTYTLTCQVVQYPS